MSLSIVPVTFAQAKAFVAQHHRHHGPTRSWKFGMGVRYGEALVGVIIVGRPVSRVLDDGFTAEVARCCTDGTRNACSMLYGAAARTAREMGFHKILTYTLAEEPGASLRGAGWMMTAMTQGYREWSCPSRPRNTLAPTTPKKRWEKPLYVIHGREATS
jgi:hypothetical protein